MKSLIAFIGCTFLTIASYANNFQTRLTVTNFQNSNLRIVIDGNRYDNFGNTLSLNNLSTGYHSIKVYQVNKGFLKGNRLLYSTSVYFKPDHHVNVVINRRGDVTVADRQIGGRGNNRNDRYGKNRRDNKRGNDRYDRDDAYDKGRNSENRRGYPYRWDK